MANREENLKKINAELEQLSDEELEKVAGGNAQEMATDIKKELNVNIESQSRIIHWTVY